MKDTVEFLEILQETDKAYKFDFGGGHTEWLPLSQISVDENNKTVTMPKWLYESKFKP